MEMLVTKNGTGGWKRSWLRTEQEECDHSSTKDGTEWEDRSSTQNGTEWDGMER